MFCHGVCRFPLITKTVIVNRAGAAKCPNVSEPAVEILTTGV
ncbi:hypothetical protein BN2497_5595 [Janthinobacterium sp. CG23_2]|nr:hypothetical protein BN2497_5595 [Janthinobacterium sp. CG23_2]CUU29195.1 hypothetical protein BN3177_5595 [Janthinobacterium sp. CG23_2]